MRKFLECTRILPSCTTSLLAIEWGNLCLPVTLIRSKSIYNISTRPVQLTQSEHQTMHLNRWSPSRSIEITQVDVGLMNALVVGNRLVLEWVQNVRASCFKTQVIKGVRDVNLDSEARKVEEKAQEIDIKSQERLSKETNLLSSMFMTDRLEQVLLHTPESLAIIHAPDTQNRRQLHPRLVP